MPLANSCAPLRSCLSARRASQLSPDRRCTSTDLCTGLTAGSALSLAKKTLFQGLQRTSLHPGELFLKILGRRVYISHCLAQNKVGCSGNRRVPWHPPAPLRLACVVQVSQFESGKIQLFHCLDEQFKRQPFESALLLAITTVRRVSNQFIDDVPADARQLAKRLEGVAKTVVHERGVREADGRAQVFVKPIAEHGTALLVLIGREVREEPCRAAGWPVGLDIVEPAELQQVTVDRPRGA